MGFSIKVLIENNFDSSFFISDAQYDIFLQLNDQKV
jgi:hypothetical protein